MELNRAWHDIADLEGGKLALSKAQSAKVVALVMSVSKQSALGDAEAQSLADNIEAVLTPAQRAEIDKDRPPGDGPPRINRADFEKVRPFMDALNPFYPPTGYAGFEGLPAEFAKDIAKHYGERRALLDNLSKRAKAK